MGRLVLIKKDKVRMHTAKNLVTPNDDQGNAGRAFPPVQLTSGEKNTDAVSKADGHYVIQNADGNYDLSNDIIFNRHGIAKGAGGKWTVGKKSKSSGASTSHALMSLVVQNGRARTSTIGVDGCVVICGPNIGKPTRPKEGSKAVSINCDMVTNIRVGIPTNIISNMCSTIGAKVEDQSLDSDDDYVWVNAKLKYNLPQGILVEDPPSELGSEYTQLVVYGQDETGKQVEVHDYHAMFNACFQEGKNISGLGRFSIRETTKTESQEDGRKVIVKGLSITMVSFGLGSLVTDKPRPRSETVGMMSISAADKDVQDLMMRFTNLPTPTP